MSLTLKQIEKLEQLREQSDANGGRDKATGSNFILYGLYRTAVMDAAPELIRLARERLEGKGRAEGMEQAADAPVQHPAAEEG